MAKSSDSRRRRHTRWQLMATALVLLASVGWARQVSAADAQGPAVLVTDSNMRPVILSSVPPSFRTVGTATFFVASTPATGTELWKIDSTGVGAALVRDINPGAAPSTPSALTEANGVLFFVADDGTHGVELWKSDGTADGTVLFSDINPGPGSSFFSALTDVKAAVTSAHGLLFFVVTGEHGMGLWRSDGTIAGTAFLTSPAALNTLVAVDGTAFFVGADSYSCFEQTLWKSNGTVAGTRLVKNIAPCSRYNLQNLTDVNGMLFFTSVPADNLTSGVKLWKSDGTEAGTVLVRELYPDVDDTADVSVLTVVDGILLFRFRNYRLDAPRSELWSSDGTTAGTVLLKGDILPQQWIDAQFAKVAGTLFFAGYDDASGWELWKTDGSVAGTVLVKDIVPGPDGSNPTALTGVNGWLAFQACEPSSGCEVWVSDGTADGTRQLADIIPGGASASLSSMTLNGSFIYVTTEESPGGHELWAIPTSALDQPPPPTPTKPFCNGDCNGDGEITVDELVTGVNIALGNVSVCECMLCDTNEDDLISIAELIKAVNRALTGCPFWNAGGLGEGGDLQASRAAWLEGSRHRCEERLGSRELP